MTVLSVSVIGSFRQFYGQVIDAVTEFESAGLTVLSPKVSHIINPGAQYPRFEADSPNSSDEQIQAVTFKKIFASDFVYTVAPGGYIGRTTCYELGRIHERGIPVYFSEMPSDLPIGIPHGTVLGARPLARKLLGSTDCGGR